jgi:glycosyltransferase involved in cell wall biosynthesis
MSERPLITFALVAYKQEKFIKEAVKGALSQSYSPLEIILSDDCSPDNTLEIMREMASAYRGPHRLVLNRNERNLGLGGHINRLVELACGELIVGAAGDDISKADRVDELFLAWERSSRKATSIVSGYETIDKDGIVTGARARFLDVRSRSLGWRVRVGPSVLGATHAFTKRTFEVFGPLDDNITAEDRVIGFRSFLVGAVIEVPKCLVQYRMHENNLWNSSPAGSSLNRFSFNDWAWVASRACKWNYYETRQFIKDLELVREGVEATEYRQAMKTLQARLTYYETLRKDMESRSEIRKTLSLMNFIRRYYQKKIFNRMHGI